MGKAALFALVLALPVGVLGCFEKAEQPPPPDAGEFDLWQPPPDRDSATPDAPPVDGPPKLELSTAAVDFGQVDCGTTGGPQKLILKNVGGNVLTYSVALDSSTSFVLGGPVTGALRAGVTAEIEVTPKPVASAAAAGVALQSLLVVQTNDAAKGSTDVPVRLVPAGATLALSPAKVAFGEYPIQSQAPDVPVSLRNTGNKAITINLAQPADSQFGLAWTGAPGAVQLAPGADVPGLTARFRPTTTTASATSAKLSFSGATCGAVIEAIPLEGRGANGVVGVSPGSLDFGQVNCGATAAAQTFTVSNTGNASVTWSAALRLAARSPFTLSPASGTLAAGGRVTVTVTPKAVPPTSSTASDAFADDVSVTTSAVGDAPHAVSLHQTARGAVLALSGASLAFGDVPVLTSRTATLSLTNSGNAPATLGLKATGSGFAVSPSAPTQVGASPLTVTTTFSPTTAGAYTGSLAMAAGATDVLCAPLPAAVALSGNGTNGAVALSTQAVDFGSSNCGVLPAARTLTLRNTGNAGFGFTTALPPGTLYTVSPSSGTIAPNETATLTVTPARARTTFGAYSETLTISTSITGDTAHPVTLSQMATGAVLRFAPTTPIAFGDRPVGTNATAAFSVANDGNVDANVTLALPDAAYTLTPASTSVTAGRSAPVTLTFTSRDTAAHPSSIVLSTTAPLCSALPSPLGVSAQGTSGVASVSPTQLAFGAGGLQDCGAPAAAAQSVVVQNSGTAPFDITGVSFTSPGYSYTASATNIPAGRSATLTVTPPAINGPLASIVPNGFGATMTIRTNIPGGKDLSVALNMTARGAILRYSSPANFGGVVDLGQVTTGGSSSSSVGLTNDGNASVTLAGSLALPPAITMGLSPSNVLAGASTVTAVFTFTPTSAGVQTGTATPLVTGVLCSAPPSTITVRGQGLSGVFGTKPDRLDFGTVTCGSPGQAQTLTIFNSGDAPYDFKLSTSSKAFAVTPEGGTLAPGEALRLQVQPTGAPTPSLGYLDTLRVVTSIYGDKPHDIPLTAKAAGVLLRFYDAQGVPLTRLAWKGVGEASFQLRNEGTVAVAFQITTSAPFYTTGQTQKAAPGGAVGGVVTFRPSSKGVFGDQLRVNVLDPATQTCWVESVQLDGTY